MKILKISAKSNPKSVAGFLADTIRLYHETEMITIGAGALNVAVKAVIIARGFLAISDITPVLLPSFIDVSVEGKETTGIKLRAITLKNMN